MWPCGLSFTLLYILHPQHKLHQRGTQVCDYFPLLSSQHLPQDDFTKPVVSATLTYNYDVLIQRDHLQRMPYRKAGVAKMALAA